MPSNSAMIQKLQRALNMRGMRIMYSTSQFYSAEQDRPITIYSIKQAIWDEDKGKFINQELYKNTSQLKILLYLRDIWYTVNGRELPPADEQWESERRKLQSSQKGEY